MAVNLKQLSQKETRLTGGHRACAGCAAPIIVRQILMASDKPVVVGSATGCLEVTTTVYPYTAWNVNFIHNAFENAAATISGVEAAFNSLKRQGKLEGDFNFVAFGGDGGTYDIGFQSLSGAMERGHDMLYVCYDNGAYMNTGIQRSSATPHGANTSTTPAGKESTGKKEYRKDLTQIMAAHNIPYVAQASVSNHRDLIAKAQKAFSIKGPKFLNVLSPCRLGWAYDPEITVPLAQQMVDSCFWPLFEVVDGEWKLTYKPKNKPNIEEWMKKQGRFKHLFRSDEGKQVIAEAQADVDARWEQLLARCGEK
ncbi:MAG: thiamine pyrophosphate-dependent enzyme [Firmicutes bacterium]|nr:thiamine pyrophosphate-dependent enzyme [Bacillota bacterium]MDD4694197.1 thiamine pyrophosphate-dependent enzyme [Bacillota bacterium]